MSRRSARIASAVVPAATSVASTKAKSAAASTSSPAIKRSAVEKDSEAYKYFVYVKKPKKAEPALEPYDDGLSRCIWANSSRYPLLQKYHDEEWCIPGGFDRTNRYLFEMLILEGAQAGLSWSTVLHKREAYRAAYDHFDYAHIAKTYTSPSSNERLLRTNIVKNKLKVEASIVNARLFVELLDEFCPDHTGLDDKEGFWKFLEQYMKTPARVLESRATPGYKTSSEESDRLSADLKKRGFKFVGTTIIHAYLVALGIEVEDARHSESCFKHRPIPKK
ncbi:hypothetical protein BGZ74_001446 [Mortierella antarctica]|nr:hypothetical protein BGZ74_001446 [Mortierella antarctica]KAG0356096.1 hypothetical protein BG005_004999 [Podila minutissima]